MRSTRLFPIGEVAKLFHLSVSSLRHYEDIGLLKPEKVDPDSGYRYYSTTQFEVLNTIRYLRALDLPLPEIKDFLENRDVDKIKEKLKQQKETVIEKEEELARVERKIDNRIRMIEDAQSSKFDTVQVIKKAPCKIVWLSDSLTISGFLDMETSIRRLESSQREAVVFLGKVGVGISEQHLQEHTYEKYDGIFLVLEEEDQFEGKTMTLPRSTCVTIRFHGSHTEAPKQYKKLMTYIEKNDLQVSGFSREVTLIDNGFTSDTKQFVTEISIPVVKKKKK